MVSGITVPPYARFLQSVIINREISNRGNETSYLHGLGMVARCLGDYAGAIEACEQSLRISRDIGDDVGQMSVFCTLSLVAHNREANQDARRFAEAALQIAQSLDDGDGQAHALNVLGHAWLALGHPDQARESYERALQVRRSLQQPHMAAETLAGLARVALAQDDTSQALAQAEAILAHLNGGTLDGTEEPLRVYLTCYQALQAAGDQRAAGVLEQAHATLWEQTAKIADEAMRRSFLENVPHHRAIEAAWMETTDSK
jgi:tetratricopeptide (TPR) repeat protein